MSDLADIHREYLDGRVTVRIGDITTLQVDAIVNAANASLLGGGGVDGAIHRRGGPAILEACRELRRTRYPAGLPTGEAVITSAGKLPARWVIHTVGPIWGRDHPAPELLASCYRESLRLAQLHSLQSLAFPAISTGVYGFPKPLAAEVVSQTLAFELDQYPLARVTLIYFSADDAELFSRHQRFPGN